MSLISYSNISDGTTIDASDVNNPMNTIFNDYNGNIDSNNLASNAITTAKITDGNVTPAKLQSGTGSSWTWQNWSPTYANISVGNGTATAKYVQIGKLVYFHWHLLVGSTTTLDSNMTISLPVTAASHYNNRMANLGDLTFHDSGTGFFGGQVVTDGSTTLMSLFFNTGTNGALTSTFGGVEAAGDDLDVAGCFEAA